MTQASANPLLTEWTTPDGAPPFDRIKPEHFRAAYQSTLAEHETEIAAIAANAAPPTFDNTIGAMERSGRALTRVRWDPLESTCRHASLSIL